MKVIVKDEDLACFITVQIVASLDLIGHTKVAQAGMSEIKEKMLALVKNRDNIKVGRMTYGFILKQLSDDRQKNNKEDKEG